jgi:hypothetical protein
MKDALLIFFCFILILLFGFSIASWSLLTTTEQVKWSTATNSSFSNFTVTGEGGSDLWNWQLVRNILNWGIWKLFGQIAEPYNGAVSGTNTVDSIISIRYNKSLLVTLENDAYGTFVFLFAIGFTVISNVLLLNVLIAMFK